MMARFRKLPVIVDAVLIRYKVAAATAFGTLRGRPGNWLVKGVGGEQTIVSDDIFRATYEPVNDEAHKMMKEG